jgi:hypothetical protein
MHPAKIPRKRFKQGLKKLATSCLIFCISNILLDKDVQKEISQDGCGKCSALSELPPLLL